MVRKLQPKMLRSQHLPGSDVAIETVQVSINPIIYEVTAIIGGHTYSERHTIGAMGTGPKMTVAELQAEVDRFRQSVADAAAWQVSMSDAQSGVV